MIKSKIFRIFFGVCRIKVLLPLHQLIRDLTLPGEIGELGPRRSCIGELFARRLCVQRWRLGLVGPTYLPEQHCSARRVAR